MNRDERCDGRNKITGHSSANKAVSGQAAIIAAMFVFMGLMVGVLVLHGSVVNGFIPGPIGQHPVSDEITGAKNKSDEKPEHGSMVGLIVRGGKSLLVAGGEKIAIQFFF